MQINQNGGGTVLVFYFDILLKIHFYLQYYFFLSLPLDSHQQDIVSETSIQQRSQ